MVNIMSNHLSNLVDLSHLYSQHIANLIPPFRRCWSQQQMWTEAGLSMTATPPSATAALTTSCVSGRRYCLGRKLGRCLSRPTPESMVCTCIGTCVCTYNCSILALNCSLLSAHVCVCVCHFQETPLSWWNTKAARQVWFVPSLSASKTTQSS